MPRTDRNGLLLLLTLVAVHALSVLAAPLVPTNDGSAHAWNAALLLHWTDPAWADITAWYRFDPRPVPNWTGHLLLAALQSVFSPEVADKLALAGFTVALPLAAAWALDGLRKGAAPLAILLLPTVHGVPFHMGFLNFCLGTVLWWVVVGAWWRTRAGPPVRRGLLLGALGLALYFTHGLVWLGAWGALFVFAAFSAVVEKRGWGELGLLGLAAAPSAALAVGFAGGGEGLVWLLDGGTRVDHLVGLEGFVSVHPAEGTLAPLLWPLVLAPLAWTWLKTREATATPRDGTLLLYGFVFAAYFVAPDGISGATFIHVRVMLFIVFAAVLALAARPLEGRANAAVLLLGAVLSLALLIPRATRWQAVGSAVAERVEVLDGLPDGARVIHVQAGPVAHPWTDFGWRVRPLAHVVGWSAAKRPLRALPNYEAGSGHFPLVWAEGRDPRPELNHWLLAPPPLDLAGWEARGERLDHVLVSGDPAGPEWAPIGGFLEAGFTVAERGEGWALHSRR